MLEAGGHVYVRLAPARASGLQQGGPIRASEAAEGVVDRAGRKDRRPVTSAGR